MIEERLDRIEGMITQLIQMVGENNKVVKNVEQRMNRIDSRMDGMEDRMERIEGRMDGMEDRMDRVEGRMVRMEQRLSDEQKLNEQRHQELMKEIRNSSFEIEYLRNQSAKHDMEIHVLKQG